MAPPLRFRERPRSRDGGTNPPWSVRRYFCSGTNDSSTVKAIAQGSIPYSLITDEGSILYREGDITVRSGGHNLWDIEARFGTRNLETGSFSIDFSTGGGTLHITAAKESIARFPNTAPDYKGVIGVRDNKHVEGADIVIPMAKRTITYRHPAGELNLSKLDYLEEITGLVNSTPFMGRPAGEVLFIGATGSISEAETACKYEIALQKNLVGASIAGITGVSKLGWHLYWTRDMPDVDGGKPTRLTKSIHVERVYDTIDLATALGFGG